MRRLFVNRPDGNQIQVASVTREQTSQTDSRTPAGGPSLGDLLVIPMAARAEAVEHYYSYRDLERESGVSSGYACQAVKGQRPNPSREIICAWVHALDPYLSKDAALLAAG